MHPLLTDPVFGSRHISQPPDLAILRSGPATLHSPLSGSRHTPQHPQLAIKKRGEEKEKEGEEGGCTFVEI